MAVFNIRMTGTKTIGASNFGDFSDSNCYASSNINGAYANASNGDKIIFEDQVHDISAKQAFNTQAASVAIDFHSRSGDPSICQLSSSIAADVMFNFNQSTHIFTPTFNNIVFTNSVAFTGTTAALLNCANAVGDVVFNNCRFNDIVTLTTAAGLVGLIMDITPHDTAIRRTVTFNDTQFNGNSFTSGARPAISAYNTTGEVTLNFNDCTADGNAFEYTDEGNAQARQGFVFMEKTTAELNINGFNFNNTTITGSGADTVFGLVDVSLASIVDVDEVHLDNITKHGAGGSRACFITMLNDAGTNTIANSTTQNCSNTENGNTIGCLIVIGNDAHVDVDNCHSFDNSGFYGSCIYATASGSFTAKNCTGHNNDGGASGIGDLGEDIEGVDFYSGGTGDAAFKGCATWGSSVQNLVVGGHAASTFILVNNASPRTDRIKAVTIDGCSFSSVVSDVPTVGFRSVTGDQSKTHTIDVSNTIMSGGNDDIYTEDQSTNPIILSIDRSIHGDIRPFGNGTITETNKIGTEAGFIDEAGGNLRLAENSDAVASGDVWWSEVDNIDMDGEPRPRFDADVGAYQSSHGEFHP